MIQNSVVLEYNGHNKKITVTTDKITKSLGSLGVIQYDSTVFNGKRTKDDFTFISSINSKEIYGLKWDTSTVTVLSSIIVTIDGQKYMINESAFNDLYFPSLCEIAYNERPIEAYMSPNKKCIYLYITGGQPGANYFCKIIFDIESKKTVGRMIAESHELSWYRAVNNDFIGF